MSIREKLFCLVLAAALLAGGTGASAQTPRAGFDTLECHIVGFGFGVMMPAPGLSAETRPDGSVSRTATMASLYKPPYLDFGLNGIYKYKSNWLVTLNADLWFGSDNLQRRAERMGAVYTRDSTVIGTNGTDAGVSCHNRAFALGAGVGKVFPIAAAKNPNSGPMALLGARYWRQQTIFVNNDVKAPAVTGDYALLYDHQRQGFILSESVGYWFMSNYANLVNFYVAVEVSQCWSRSTRDYTIDHYLGLQGRDKNSYFDLLFTLKLGWMFPLKGKTTHERYFY